MGKFASTAGAVAVLFLVGATSASADPILGPENQGVMTRARPDFDAKGLPLGGLRLFPTLDAKIGYDDNVIRQSPALAKGSMFFEETPGLRLQSEWSRHEFDLYANMDALQYSSLSNDSQTNFTFGGDGRLDVTRGIDVLGGGSYANMHEARNSPEQAGNALKPTSFRQSNANASFEYHPYSFAFSFGGTYQRSDYSATLINGGPPLSNKDRNGDIFDVFGKAAYEFSPGYAAFVRADYNTHSFDLALDRNGFHRASHGYAVNGGLDVMLTHFLRGEVFAGYLNQQFKGTILKPLANVSGVDFGANLDWYATGLLTVHLSAAHAVNDTIIALASASTDNSVGVSADYELARNVLVNANVGYRDSKYSSGVRDDKYTDAGLKLKYLFNHYMSADVGYTYEHRASSAVGGTYDDNIATAGLTLHL